MGYQLNGTSQFISSNAPATALPITMACRVFVSGSHAGYGVVMSLTNSNAATLTHFFLDLVSGAPRAEQRSGGSTASASGGAAIPLNEWVSVAGVYESLSSRRVFVNGNEVAANATALPAISEALTRLSIGARNRASIDGYLNGRIAESAVWTAALSASEIKSLGSGVKSSRIRPQSLVYYDRMIRSLQDLCRGLAITNNNGATVANHPRVY
jgi:hypothetical protein